MGDKSNNVAWTTGGSLTNTDVIRTILDSHHPWRIRHGDTDCDVGHGG